MLGISVKVWKLGWDQQLREFTASDSSVFVFQDRSIEDISYVQSVIRHLTGDGSLDSVFTSTVETLIKEPTDLKAEEVLPGEPKKEDVTEPIVKVEVDEKFSDDECEVAEDNDDETEQNEDENEENEDEDENEEYEETERRSKRRREKVNYSDDEDDSDFEINESDEEAAEKDDAEEAEMETCDRCGKSYQIRGHFRKHLQKCNPSQIPTLPPRYTLKMKAKMKTEDGRSQKESVEKRLKTLAKTAENCNNCMKSFKHRSFLVHHLKECNPDQIPELVNCKMSKKVAKRMKAILADDATLTCQFCPRKFTFKKSLEKHEALHKSDPDSPKLDERKIRKYNPNQVRIPMGNYQCDRCSSSFKLYTALERHMEAHMLAATTKPEDKQDELTDHGLGLKVNEIRDGAMMRCVRCDLVYSTRGMYQQHMKQYHAKALSCEECGKQFTLPNSLNTHRLNHHTSFPKDCEDCGKFCGTKKEYQEHMKEAHGQGRVENTVPCEICGKMVKNKYSLKSHVKLVHEKNGSNFPCDKCGKILKSKGSLDYHSKVHTGEYKFRCDECGHGYMRFDQMQDCKNTHQGIFKFNCPHCDYKTNKNKALSNHITTHSAAKPWICPICQHTSSTTSNLNNHIKKVHKMTLCQAEALTKRSRYGRDMTEEEIEQNLILVQRGASTLETKELYSDSQQQAVNMKILDSRKRGKMISGGQASSVERDPESSPQGQLDLSARHQELSARHAELSARHSSDLSGRHSDHAARHPDLSGRHLDLPGRHPDLPRQLDLSGRPPLFLPGGQKYF